MDSLPGSVCDIELQIPIQTERPEEKEEQEYQEKLYEKMRQELDAELANYVDDDDDSFIYTANSHNQNGCTPYNVSKTVSYRQNDCSRTNLHNNSSSENLYTDTDLNSMSQMKLLLDARTREVHKKTEELAELKLETNKRIDNINSQLEDVKNDNIHLNAVIEDLRRILQMKEDQVINLRSTVESQKAKIDHLEKEMEKKTTELEVVALTNRNLHDKISILEKYSQDSLNAAKLEKQLQQKDQDYREVVSRLDTELELSYKKNQRLEKEKMDLENQIRNLYEVQNEWQKEKIASTKEIQKLQEQVLSPVTGLKSEIDVLKAKLVSLTAEAEYLKQSCEEKDNTIYQLRAVKNLSSTSQPVQLLQEELDKKCEDIKHLRQERALLHADLQSKGLAVSAFSETITNLKKTIEEKNLQLDDMAKKIKELDCEKEAWMKESSRKLLDQESEAKMLKERIKSLEEVNTKLQSAIEETAGMISVNKYNEEFTKYLDEKVAKVRSEMTKQLQDKDTIIKVLREDKEKVKRLYMELKDRLDTNNDVEKMSKELEESRKRMLDFEASVVGKFETELHEKDLKIDTLQAKIDKLKADLSQVNDDYRKMVEQRNEKVRRVEELEQKVEECTTKFIHAKEEIVSWQEKMLATTKNAASAGTSPVKWDSNLNMICIPERELEEKMELLAEIHHKELEELLVKKAQKEVATMTDALPSEPDRSGEYISESELRRYIEITRINNVQTLEQLRLEHNSQMDRLMAAHQKELARIKNDHKDQIKEIKNEMEKRFLLQERDALENIQRLQNNYDEIKNKARECKVYYSKALEKLAEKWKLDRESQDRMLFELYEDVQKLLRPNVGDLRSKLNHLAKKCDEQIFLLRDRKEI